MFSLPLFPQTWIWITSWTIFLTIQSFCISQRQTENYFNSYYKMRMACLYFQKQNFCKAWAILCGCRTTTRVLKVHSWKREQGFSLSEIASVPHNACKASAILCGCRTTTRVLEVHSQKREESFSLSEVASVPHNACR